MSNKPITPAQTRRALLHIPPKIRQFVTFPRPCETCGCITLHTSVVTPTGDAEMLTCTVCSEAKTYRML